MKSGTNVGSLPIFIQWNSNLVLMFQVFGCVIPLDGMLLIVWYVGCFQISKFYSTKVVVHKYKVLGLMGLIIGDIYY